MYKLVKKLLSPSTLIITELKGNSSKVRSEGNYYIWKKGESFSLSNHFETNEFSCKCTFHDCIEQRISKNIVSKVESIRIEVGQPVYITSAFRCSKHQNYLRSAGLKTSVNKSQHELGNAVDIVPKDGKNIKTRFLDIVSKYFKSIGLSDSFLHVDLREDKERRWDY